MVYTKYSKIQAAGILTKYGMSQDPEAHPMTDGRALLTDREREILAGDAEVSDNYRYKVESTARQRVRKIGKDVEVLQTHYPEIFAELERTVCEPDE